MRFRHDALEEVDEGWRRKLGQRQMSIVRRRVSETAFFDSCFLGPGADSVARIQLC